MTTITALGLTTSQTLALATDESLKQQWKEAAPGLTLVGFGDPGPERTLDPGVLASYLGDAHSPPVVTAGDTGTDLRYNLARQVLSADQLTGGRSGLLLTDGKDLSGADQPGTSNNNDYTETLVRLWHSWPRESVVADRGTGVLVESHQINTVNFGGVRGPLSVPSSAQGHPVILGYARTPDEIDRRPQDADLVVTPLTPADSSHVRWLGDVELDTRLQGKEQVHDQHSIALQAGASGILLRAPSQNTDRDDHDDHGTVRELLEVVTELTGGPGAQAGTARELNGLPVPTAPVTEGVPAFPEPAPLPSTPHKSQHQKQHEGAPQ